MPHRSVNHNRPRRTGAEIIEQRINRLLAALGVGKIGRHKARKLRRNAGDFRSLRSPLIHAGFRGNALKPL